MRANLVAVPSSGLHDLPPRWDGCAVVWRGWVHLEAIICGSGSREECPSCGSPDQPTVNVGLVADDPSMTHADVNHDDEAVRLAYSMRQRRKRRTWLRLTAFRCVECGADTVLDSDGVLWTLDPSDYGDAGSARVRVAATRW